MLPTLFQAIQGNTKREKNENDPIFGDGALMNHSGKRRIDPAFLDFVGMFVESEETDVG